MNGAHVEYTAVHIDGGGPDKLIDNQGSRGDLTAVHRQDRVGKDAQIVGSAKLQTSHDVHGGVAVHDKRPVGSDTDRHTKTIRLQSAVISDGELARSKARVQDVLVVESTDKNAWPGIRNESGPVLYDDPGQDAAHALSPDVRGTLHELELRRATERQGRSTGDLELLYRGADAVDVIGREGISRGAIDHREPRWQEPRSSRVPVGDIAPVTWIRRGTDISSVGQGARRHTGSQSAIDTIPALRTLGTTRCRTGKVARRRDTVGARVRCRRSVGYGERRLVLVRVVAHVHCGAEFEPGCRVGQSRLIAGENQSSTREPKATRGRLPGEAIQVHDAAGHDDVRRGNRIPGHEKIRLQKTTAHFDQ